MILIVGNSFSLNNNSIDFTRGPPELYDTTAILAIPNIPEFNAVEKLYLKLLGRNAALLH